MDIIDFTDKFQKIETDNNFFAEKDTDGILYWDLVRHDVFYLLYYKVCETRLLPVENVSKFKLTMLATLFNNLFGFISFNLKASRKYKYLFFTASRNKDADKKNVDFISDDILRIVEADSFVIESFNKEIETNGHTSIFDYGLLMAIYKSRLKKKFSKRKSEDYKIAEILKQGFDVELDLNSNIGALIDNYHISEDYYSHLFNKIKPKAVFLVQNGIQKGMFVAGHRLDIPIIELQHGLIGYVHPAYSYPETIQPGKLETFPDTFFSFSDFWTSNLNYPVKKIIPIGNSYYSSRIITEVKKYDLTFIFANIYSEDLLHFINGLLQDGYDGEICIKLHPNQFVEFDTIRSLYAEYGSIDVVSSQKSMGEVLSVSKAIFVVQSTAVYEALQNKVKVYLYKIKDYLTHQDVIGNPNVYLVDKATDITEFDRNNFIDSEEYAMFEPFKEDAFNEFIQNI